MTHKDVYNIWAPPDGPWSIWAKPVLFAHLDVFRQTQDVALPIIDTGSTPPADGTTALVLDLPGTLGVAAAIAFARIGYRPVPLYNAVPFPTAASSLSETPPAGPVVVCDIAPIMNAILLATPGLDQLNLPYHAPPAFLLDADRRYGSAHITPTPGMFDNRSISLPTDFPSATFLLSQGITRAVIVQADSIDPQADLAHALLRWQQAGIAIVALTLAHPAQLTPIQVAKPSFFRSLLHRVIATMSFRRHPLGGFGGFLPIPSSS